MRNERTLTEMRMELGGRELSVYSEEDALPQRITDDSENRYY